MAKTSSSPGGIALQSSSRQWLILSAALGGIQLFSTIVLPIGISLIALSDLIALLLFVILIVVVAGNAARGHGRLRAFWLLQSLSWLIFFINQAWWTWYDLVLKKPVPMFFAGDVLPLFGTAFLLFAFLLRPNAQQTRPSLRRGTLDFILLMVWWFFAYCYLVQTWQVTSPNEQIFNRNYNALFLALNLALFALLFLLFLQAEARWKRFYGLFLCAALIRYGSFVLENRAIEQDRYFSGSWYDCLYAGVFTFFLLVSLEGRALPMGNEITLIREEPRGRWVAGLAIVAVLSLPAILVFTAHYAAVPVRVTEFRILLTAGAMFVMTALTFTKQFLMHQELKCANHALEESATTDPLTGLRNRRFFSETIHTHLAQTLRARIRGDQCKQEMIFYLVDIDDFKQVNDLFGHDAGDSVLRETAGRMKAATRDSDVVVRWGGEEFLIVSQNTDRRNADQLAQRVLEAVRSKTFSAGELREVRLTCSVGWAPFPSNSDPFAPQEYEETLKLADRALYRAKHAGKNRAMGITAADAASPPAHHDELEMHGIGKG